MEVNKNDNAPAMAMNETRWAKEMDSDSLKYWVDYYTGLFQNAIDTHLIPNDHVLLNALKYNLLNEGRGEHLKALYDDILEYQGETNPTFLNTDSDIPFGDSYQEGLRSEVAAEEDVDEWEELVLSRSQLDLIGGALKVYVDSKAGQLNADETCQLNCLLESLYG